jgi:hypothetical protein
MSSVVGAWALVADFEGWNSCLVIVNECRRCRAEWAGAQRVSVHDYQSVVVR